MKTLKFFRVLVGGLVLFVSAGFVSSEARGLQSPVRQALYEERRVAEFKKAILANDFSHSFSGSEAFKCYNNGLCRSDYELFIFAIDELWASHQLKTVDLENRLDWLRENSAVQEADAIHYVWNFRADLPEEWERVFLRLGEIANGGAYTLGFISPKIRYIIDEELEYLNLVPVDPNRIEMARDLLEEKIPGRDFKNGAYKKAIRLYMFCRDDRRYACLMVARDARGNLIREQDNSVWTHSVLGYSRHNLRYNQVRGSTPAGVWTLDGVMPVADKKADYGQWRRVIMNFIPSSQQEKDLRSLLPSSSRSANWWQESVIARNMGRSAFRIHGTQQAAPVGEPYFPFYGTSGCIANRENTYDAVTYRDQREMLDALMEMMQLSPIYENETKIQAILYVMNIDSKEEWVSLNDLEQLKILR